MSFDGEELRRYARMATRRPLEAPYTPDRLLREVAERLVGHLQPADGNRWSKWNGERWVTYSEAVSEATVKGAVAKTMRAMYDEIVARPETTFDRSTAAEVLLDQAIIHAIATHIRPLLAGRVE